jgi:hypothetical protein
MLGHDTRDARRTERYLDGLMSADERRAHEVPADTELDPAVRLAARELRSGLLRVHPSFRFEESLAARLWEGAARLRAGLPVEAAPLEEGTGRVAQFRGGAACGEGAATAVPAGAASATPSVATPSRLAAPATLPEVRGRALWPTASLLRLPEMTSRPSRPLIVGGVGVASAISIGAAYVVWRHSHPPSGRMGRAARQAHSRASQPSHRRRSAVIHGILGVVS